MIHFGLIAPHDIQPEEFLLLGESTKTSIDGTTAEDVVNAALAGHARLWRGIDTDGGHIILATQIFNTRAGRELFLWQLAGSGIARIFKFKKKVNETLDAYAEAMECVRITSLSTPEMVRLMESIGFYTTHHQMVKAVMYGR